MVYFFLFHGNVHFLYVSIEVYLMLVGLLLLKHHHQVRRYILSQISQRLYVVFLFFSALNSTGIICVYTIRILIVLDDFIVFVCLCCRCHYCHRRSRFTNAIVLAISNMLSAQCLFPLKMKT